MSTGSRRQRSIRLRGPDERFGPDPKGRRRVNPVDGRDAQRAEASERRQSTRVTAWCRRSGESPRAAVVAGPGDVRVATRVDDDRLEVAQPPVLAEVVADRAHVVDRADMDGYVAAQLALGEKRTCRQRVAGSGVLLVPTSARAVEVGGRSCIPG